MVAPVVGTVQTRGALSVVAPVVRTEPAQTEFATKAGLEPTDC